jgi:TonB family protein
MATRNKPYEQFGPFILFKKLEADAHGDLWRAGRIEGGQLGSTVALRRMTGGVREAVIANAEAAAQILPKINGTSFVREQQAGVIDHIPYLAWDYAGGRSVRHIIDRARGGKDVPPNPLPLDQAIVIAEKVALSLATMAELRDTSGGRLFHGALIPQFIWISDDGEIRVAGQQLGGGLIASLRDPNVSSDIGRYFSPEYRTSGQVQKHTDVYSMGAVLFLLVTGQEPPDAATASAFGSAVRAAKTMNGSPIPDDIRVVLDKSFNLDPAMRYASIGDMKQAISALANSGKYSATTFNLAFYLSTLLKKEMEIEATEREKEAKVALAPYLEAPKPAMIPIAAPAAAPAAAAPAPTPQMFAAAAPKKSKLPMIAIAVGALAAIGAGGYMMLSKNAGQAPAKQPVAASALPVAAPQPRLISEPIAVTATPAVAAPAATTSDDAAAQQKAFEEAVRLKMQAEMMKLQDSFIADLKQKQSKNAPVAAAPVPVQQAAPQEERPAMTAAQMTASQLEQRRETRPEPVPETRTAAPAPVQALQQTQPAVQQQQQPAVAAPVQQQAVTVREGDVIDVGSLDALPRPTRAIRPTYPPMAARQKISATIFLTVLVSETGEVMDVRVLRGDPRFGLNDAAIRAMKQTRFSAPMKDGKRVRTWFPQTIDFKP